MTPSAIEHLSQNNAERREETCPIIGVGKDEGVDRGDGNDGDDTSVTVRVALEEEKSNYLRWM